MHMVCVPSIIYPKVVYSRSPPPPSAVFFFQAAHKEAACLHSWSSPYTEWKFTPCSWLLCFETHEIPLNPMENRDN